MRPNLLKRRLKGGETVVGVFNAIHSPAVVEMLGLLGLDFAIMDAEHTTLTPETAEGLYRAAELRSLPTVTRIGENSPQVVQKFMDAGSQGVLMPMVNTEEEARRVVQAVKYPPLGRRGLAGVRAADWGLTGSTPDYVREANEETLVAVQVETTEAVKNFDRIAAVDGIDIIFFGPSDLASNLGMPGQTKHPEVVALIERLGKKTVEAGKAAGTLARDPEEYARWKAKGFQWLCTGTAGLLAQGVRGFLDSIGHPRRRDA